MNFSSVVQGNPPLRGGGAHGYTSRGRGIAASSASGLSGVGDRRSFSVVGRGGSVVGRGGSSLGSANHEPLGVDGRGSSANDVSAAIGNGALPPGRRGMPRNGRGANSSRGSGGISSVPHLRRNSHLN